MDAEKAVLEQLRQQYQRALNDIDRKIRILESDELTQSRIYRLEYQKTLKKQVEAILEKLHSDQFTTIQQFLSTSYTDAFVGTAYDMFGQGVPLIMPIDQNAAVKAIITDSKIDVSLYESLGVDTNKLKKAITAEITRGIAGGLPHSEISRNLANAAKISLGRAKTIVRTESHRIQEASAQDARKMAVSKGASVVKQWKAIMDGKVRHSHRVLDGQIVEVDKPFEIDGMEAMYPGDFGDPSMDCNCRCRATQRSKIALGEEEYRSLQKRARFFGMMEEDSKEFGHEKEKVVFSGFKEKYMKATNDVEKFSKEILEKASKNTKKTVANSAKMLYNNTLDQKPDTKALEAYNRAIEIGELTPMASFELYQAISKEIDDVIVGKTTSNGISITGKSDHFIARVIGSISQRRSGVSIDDIVLALTNPDRVDPPVQGSVGRSQRFIKSHVCAVTINPDTGKLIQVNPLG